jgi:hypothetical protein
LLLLLERWLSWLTKTYGWKIWLRLSCS